MDVAKAIADIKAGKVEYRVDKTSIVHCPIGKASFGVEKLEENLTLADGCHREGQAGRREGDLPQERRRVVHNGPGRQVQPGPLWLSNRCRRGSCLTVGGWCDTLSYGKNCILPETVGGRKA